MKQRKTLLLVLLAVIFVIGIFPVSAQAADRQYVIRVSAGNKGTFPGNEMYTVTLPYDSYLTVPEAIADEGYYVKGIKESGKDSFMNGYHITKDQDFIVVYGVKGREVRYVIRYLEYGTNTVLAEEQTFYADPGDKPVSSYIYIEGYQPYLRTTKTLVEDESQNVLFAYYTAIPAPAAAAAGGGGGGGGAAAGGNANAGAGNANAGNANAGANANAGNNANANADNANTDNNANAAAGTDNNNTAATQPTTPPQAYAQLEDIQDLDVPLASFEDIVGSTGSTGNTDSANDEPTVGPGASATIQQNTRPKLLPKGLLIFFIVLLFCLIGLLYWYLLFYRKKKKYADVEVVTFAEDEEEDDDFDIESFRNRHNKNKRDE